MVISKKHKITTVGSAVMDIMFKTSEGVLIDNRQDPKRQQLMGFEYGAKLVSNDVHFCYGGGALNAAATFNSLGLRPQVITAVGHDAMGRDILRNLKFNHISDNLLQIKTGHGTAVSFIVTVKGHEDRVIFYYPGARGELQITAGLASKIRTPWIYLTSLSGSKWQTSLSNLFSHATRNNIKVAWNPGVDELKAGYEKLKRYFHLTEVLIVNLDEATELLMSAGEKIKQPVARDLIKKLQQFGQSISVITQGAKGAYVYDGKKLLYKSALRNRVVVNTTGAGDAFGSGFVAGLFMFKYNLSRALALGVSNSGLVVSKVGAQNGIITKAQLKKLNI